MGNWRKPGAFPVELAVRVATAAIGYGFVLLLARVLDPGPLGQTGALLSAALILGAVSTGGHHLLVVRLGSDPAQGALLGSLFQRADRGALLVSIGTLCVGLAVLGVRVAAGYAVDDGLTWAFLAALVLVPLLNRAEMMAYLGRARQQVVVGLAARDLIWRPLTGVAVLGVVLFGRPATPGMVLGLAAAALALALIGQGRLLPRPRVQTGPLGQIPVATPFWIVSVTGLVLGMADVIVAATVLPAQDSGGYFVANRVATAAGMIALAQASALAPILARAYQQGALHDAVAPMQRIVRLSFGATLVLCLGLGLLAKPVLALFAPDLVGSAGALRWLLTGVVLAAAFGPTDMILSMTGHERIAMWLCVSALIVMVPLLPFAAWAWGDAGLAAAISLLVVGRKAVAAAIITVRLGVRGDVLALRRGESTL